MSDKTMAAFAAAGKGQKGTPTAYQVEAARSGEAFKAALKAGKNIGAAPIPPTRASVFEKEMAVLKRRAACAAARSARAAARVAAARKRSLVRPVVLGGAKEVSL